MRRAGFIIMKVVLFASLLVFAADAVYAVEEAVNKQKCKMCHNDLFKKWDKAKVKHFPYSEGMCETCHAEKHKTFVGEIGDICAGCHDPASDEIRNAHFGANIAGTDCAKCHYPHASKSAGLLKEVIHGPVQIAMCDKCHTLDEENKIKVKNNIKEICLGCHDNIVSKANTVLHPGFEMVECTNCHNPHTAGREKLINHEKISEVCFECHDKDSANMHPYDIHPSEKISVDKTKPWLINAGEVVCTSCHNPHQADRPFLLRGSVEHGELCHYCHQE